MHDRNGTAVQKGDVVLIEAVIGETYACEDFCNVSLRIGYDKPHAADNVQSNVTLNARQVLLLRRP